MKTPHALFERRCILTALVPLLVSSYAASQCATQWVTNGYPGANGTVYAATAWDPDGTGPLATQVVLGGTFSIFGDLTVANIAAFDPIASACSTIGSGMNGAVTELEVAANGDLVAAGSFTNAGGTVANYVARWNGVSWSALGAGPGGPVSALETLANGSIVVATATDVLFWDGSAWSSLGAVTTVKCLFERSNGDLIAGGDFTTIGGVSAIDIAMWNGATWLPIGGGIPGNETGAVNAMVEDLSGRLVAAGSFRRFLTASLPITTDYVARWDGAAWSGYSGDIFYGGSVEAVAIGSTGEVLVGGSLNTIENQTYVAQTYVSWPFPGTPSWLSLGAEAPGSTGTVYDFVVLGWLDIVAVGSFSAIGYGSVGGPSRPCRNVARLAGDWVPTSRGTDDRIEAMAVAANGDIYVGGRFRRVDDTLAQHIAVWTGAYWNEPGLMDAPVTAICARRNGGLIAGGFFKNIAGPMSSLPANNIAIGDGFGYWSALGSGWETQTGGSVFSILEMANGNIAAGGSSFLSSAAPAVLQVKIWNGTSWSTVPFAGAGSVRALAELANGDLLMAGPGINGIERWNGTTKTMFAAGGQVNVLTKRPNGDIIAGGVFASLGGTVANGIAVWNGTTWSPLGTGMSGPGEVHDIDILPNGDLLVGGEFTAAGGIAAANVARWDGSTWSAIGAGTDGAVLAIAASPLTGVFVGGSFLFADNLVSAHLARLDSTCPATWSEYDPGCSGSFVPLTLPWVDSTFRASTWVPNPSLVFAVTSVIPVPGGVPLPSPATAGCRLFVQPDILSVVPSANGFATSEMFLPNTPPLVGVTFYHQLLPVELNALGGFVTITSTRTFQLTAGMF